MEQLTNQERHFRRQWFRAEVYAQLYHAKLKGHQGARYKAMLGQYGAWQTAKKLLNSKKNGKKVWCTELEHIVIHPAFEFMFTKKQITTAWTRIYEMAGKN